MRLPREIALLLALLVCAVGAVLWYVIDRRAKLHAAPAVTATPGPAPMVTSAPAPARQPPATAAAPLQSPVDLTQHDAQTIDFSSGHPVAKQSPEDQAALEAGLKDIAAATKDVTFEPPKKPGKP